MDQVIEGLFVGDIHAAANLFLLKQFGITHVLQALSGLNPCFPNDFEYKVLPVVDQPWENMSRHFSGCIKFIQGAIDKGGAVLVHCYAGVSRSATLAIAYLISQKHMPFSNAFKLVKLRRPQAQPNPGFYRQLIEFDKF